MGWKTRGNRLYYYRSQRVGDRVVSEYVGGGPMGRYASALDAIAEGERWQQRSALRKVIAEQDQADRQVDELGELVQQYVTALMLVGGYHQHKRQWRRKRE